MVWYGILSLSCLAVRNNEHGLPWLVSFSFVHRRERARVARQNSKLDADNYDTQKKNKRGRKNRLVPFG